MQALGARIVDLPKGGQAREREKDILLPENFYDPLLDPLREGPGYAEVLRGMGLRAVSGKR